MTNLVTTKNFIGIILITTALLFSSCSDNGDNGIVIENNNNKSFMTIETRNNPNFEGVNDLNIDMKLTQNNRNDNYLEGIINHSEYGDLNIKINLNDNQYENTIFNRISEKEIEIRNLNGANYILVLDEVTEVGSTITFTNDFHSFVMEVSGPINPTEFNKEIDNLIKGNYEKFVCGGVCIGAIATTIGAGLCAIRVTNAQNSCTRAFKAAVEAGGDCSMEFESGWCGGDCDISCNTQG